MEFADLPAGALMACGRGGRAMTAAGLLDRAGHAGGTVLNRGPAEHTAAHGLRPARGSVGGTG